MAQNPSKAAPVQSPVVIEPAPVRKVASAKHVKAGYEWQSLLSKARAATPEVFGTDNAFLNLVGGEWGTPGSGRTMISPIDGSVIGKLSMIDLSTAQKAVRAAAQEARAWGRTPLEERLSRISATLDAMRTHRDLLAGMLVWEIGKPIHLAEADVDRCIDGVAWYVEHAARMLRMGTAHERQPLGLISNIASWNYPVSVLMHAVLVQMLCGNAAIAKTPSDGGGTTVAVCCALARREGLPVSLVSGSGGVLSEALVRHDLVDCLSFVGGRSNGRDVAAALVDQRKRYMLEMEGVNAMGVWEFSNWSELSAQIRKGFEYAKQRCTAYPRFVVQRRMLPQFLETYLSTVRSLRVGHPLLVERDEDPLPRHEFGPLINTQKVEELRALISEALGGGALPVYEGRLDASNFEPGQDISAYFAPFALLNIPRNCRLYFSEPFGPVDSIIVVDRVEELIAEMNVSNGCLVSTLMTDDAMLVDRVKPELRSFKFGHNRLRSRGDREELFGGLGESWKGCFVGGELLVRAVTKGSGDDKLPGRFPDVTRMPETV